MNLSLSLSLSLQVDDKNELTLSGSILRGLQDIVTTATISDELSELASLSMLPSWCATPQQEKECTFNAAVVRHN